ncbi:glycosyl hydrolase [Methylobacterium mesophilicum]
MALNHRGTLLGIAMSMYLLTNSANSQEVTSQPTSEFLNSIGVVTSFSNRGQPFDKTKEMLKFGGFKWVRTGIEDFTDIGGGGLNSLLKLHSDIGIKFSWGLLSGNNDIVKLVAGAEVLASAGALLSIEGNNEPNNWPVTYQGEMGGGRTPSWLPVAKLQAKLYKIIKNNKLLSNYPVWTVSEPGAQRDNVGLQFLKIPNESETLMPPGTAYADVANVHNYIYHVNSPNIEDNKVWNAADPSIKSRIDGLYANFGRTWFRKFEGYSNEELSLLPRVSTETGVGIGNNGVTEEIQALNLLNLYLAQFKRGYLHTSVYLLRDRTDESGNQAFGFFNTDYTPRLAAKFLHNLTSILRDDSGVIRSGQLAYKVRNASETTHDLLLRSGDGVYKLVVWNEQIKGQTVVTIDIPQNARFERLFDPTKGIASVRELKSSDPVEIILTDHPIIIELQDNK